VGKRLRFKSFGVSSEGARKNIGILSNEAMFPGSHFIAVVGGSLKLRVSGKALAHSMSVSSRLMVYAKWEGDEDLVGWKSDSESSYAVTVRRYVLCAGKLPMIIIINRH
jgi:hypothetical protein